MFPLQLSTVLSTAALVICAFVVPIAVIAWRNSTKSYALRQIAKIDMEQIDLFEKVEQLKDTVKRGQAKLAMRQAREKLHTHDEGATAEQLNANSFAQLPGESAEDWKRRMRNGPLLRGQRPG